MSKSIEETYIKYNQREHVLNKPGMYIGSIDFIPSKQLIYEDNEIKEKKIDYNAGLYKIIDELIVNAYDQTIRDNNVDEISIVINDNKFEIYNSGSGIPIEKHKEYDIYIPELIFGHLLTSSNYDKDEKRITGGTHGIGAKATNIFSKIFIVEVWSKTKYYKQIFENNLTKINKPIIEKNNDNKTGVKITCEPDFIRFTCNHFSSDMQKLIKRRVIDLLGLILNNVKIKINDQDFTEKNINKIDRFKKYLNLYKSDNDWYIALSNKNIWYFGIRINDDKLEQNISFVNSIYTSNSGSHVEYIFELLVLIFQKLINKNINKKFLKEHLTLCLVTSIINPLFNSQSKEQLTMPKEQLIMPNEELKFKFIDDLNNSNIVNKLKELYAKQDFKLLTKFESSKKNKIKGIPKLEDANFAGTKKSINCMLILTEGDSAKATAISGISAIKNGRDIFGVYPLRGKLLNVREATTSQITNNQEIIELKKIIGLKSGTIYNKNNIDQLRYNSILLMMDADEDGSHIKGLIINFLNYFFPSLLQIEGFLKILVTPIVKVFLKKDIINFSNLRGYNNWLIKNTENYKVKYYKGLGTSSAIEAKEYFKNLENNIISVIDENNQNDILLAFSKEKINERKKWLINYNSNNIINFEPPTNITIHTFIHQELIHFSNYDNLRSIPVLADGLKPSQRKVLYACLKKNIKNEMKVAQLASFVAEITAYHHGEQSLVGTIINMAHDFVGSNNLNLLIPSGQFGTRLLGGKDSASGRYIFTYLNKIVDDIFKKEDFDLLEYQEDDGEKIEPKFYLPIIPIILVNGSEGIGTGFSTLIPNYNLKDIINWFINKLNNKKLDELNPKFNNFKGDIFKYDENTYLSSGICKIDNDKIIITELPIKLWTTNYKELLEEMIEDGLIKSYTNYSSDIDVNFEIKVNDIEKFKLLNESNDEKNLNNLKKYFKLYKTIKLTNLTLYDENLKLKTFNNVEDICDCFYKMRLPYFEKRKELLISNINNELILLNNQVKFINLFKSKPAILNFEDNELNNYLIKNKIDKHNESFDYLINMSIKQLTKNNFDKILKKIDELKKNKNKLEKQTPKELWLMDLNNLLDKY